MLGETIRKLRKEKNPTLVAFSSMTDLSPGYLSQVERGIAEPSLSSLERIAKALDIPAMIYYPIPLHLQKAYQDPRYLPGDFPVAERLAACVLSLPMHTELDEEQLQYITRNVLEIINK